MTTKSITRVAIGIVLFFIFSNIIPPITIFFSVPFTFQTLLILLLPFIFSKKEIVFWYISLIFVCLIGLPVMSGFSSGFAVLIGPTAGFIHSWILKMLFIKKFSNLNDSNARLFVVMTFATIINLVFGGMWLAVYTGQTVINSVVSTVITFIPFGIIKVLIAIFLLRFLNFSSIERK